MIYVIGDLHLSFGVDKPMNIFGEKWDNHEEKIKENWIKTVKEEDTVFHLGDFSWAMNYEQAYEDFKFLESLPGKKILLRGNHDYWWASIKKNNDFMEKCGFKTISFMQNSGIILEEFAICGTKGWDMRKTLESKNIKREVLRLKNSINDLKEKLENNENNELIKIAVMHYPPFLSKTLEKYIEEENEKKEEYDFCNILKEFGIKKCYYAHLHGQAHKTAITGNIDGIEYILVSSDYTKFNLVKIEAN